MTDKQEKEVTEMINDLMYIELKTGYSDDGPAWIGYVRTCLLYTSDAADE